MLRASDLVDNLGQENNPQWKTIAIDRKHWRTGVTVTVPSVTAGARKASGIWNSAKAKISKEVSLKLSLLDSHDDVVNVGFPYFGGAVSEHFNSVALDEILMHKLPVKRLQLADGSTASGDQRL